uniref:Uncharacterized protein n=1 Tax=Arundo donax TaxID=35708 RepID=A0A0A9DK37_ARUDO
MSRVDQEPHIFALRPCLRTSMRGSFASPILSSLASKGPTLHVHTRFLYFHRARRPLQHLRPLSIRDAFRRAPMSELKHSIAGFILCSSATWTLLSAASRTEFSAVPALQSCSNSYSVLSLCVQFLQ